MAGSNSRLPDLPILGSLEQTALLDGLAAHGAGQEDGPEGPGYLLLRLDYLGKLPWLVFLFFLSRFWL